MKRKVKLGVVIPPEKPKVINGHIPKEQLQKMGFSPKAVREAYDGVSGMFLWGASLEGSDYWMDVMWKLTFYKAEADRVELESD